MQSITEKRITALTNLKKQLLSGVKTDKKSFKKVPLTDSDKSRITREINVLESKVPKGEL